MSFLFKIIVILGLILLIVSQFTRSRQQRAARRDKWTNVLLILVIAMLGASIVTNILTR